MTDNVTSSTILCQGGLNTTENHLFLDQNFPGGATELINFEIGLYGGYRRIEGYLPFDSNYTIVDDTNAEGKIFGLTIFKDNTGVETIIAARKQKASTTYKFYQYTGAGWIAYAPGFTLNSTDVLKIRKLKFNFGNQQYVIFVDGVNFPTLFDGTNWYQLKSTNTGASLASPGGNQLLDAPKYVDLFKNTIFFCGDLNYPGVVGYMAPESVYSATAADGGGQLVAGFSTDGIKPFRDSLYVFGQRNIKNVTVSGTNFVINDTATNIGCIAPDSIQEINGDIIYLAQDGIRTISGTNKIGDINLATISKSIQSYVNSLQENFNLDYLDSTVIKKKSQFRYYLSSGDLTSDTVGIIGGIREVQDNPIWEFGKLSDIRTSCVENDYYGGQELVLHGDFDGSVYKQESGDTFNGSPITATYATPFLTFGDILTRKQPRKIHIFTRPEGTLTLSTSMVLDWNNPSTMNPTTFNGSSDTSGSVYDGGYVYDGGILYGAESDYNVIDIDLTSSFKSMKLTFTSTSDTAPFSIQGFVVDFTPQGKR